LAAEPCGRRPCHADWPKVHLRCRSEDRGARPGLAGPPIPHRLAGTGCRSPFTKTNAASTGASIAPDGACSTTPGASAGCLRLDWDLAKLSGVAATRTTRRDRQPAQNRNPRSATSTVPVVAHVPRSIRAPEFFSQLLTGPSIGRVNSCRAKARPQVGFKMFKTGPWMDTSCADVF
jgi:hypothetical protein